MCGILGTVNLEFNKTVLQLLEHRGPDDFGMEKSVVKGNRIQLGHRRLSIIDLSASGHQPMITQSQDYEIIFNGEIYNHEELKSKLPQNIIFKGHSDTETILYYLKEFGVESVRDFNGIFALAFLDKIKNKIYLARDKFGVKPLYYHLDNNIIIFSSEIRAILELLPQSSLNKEALSTLLRLRFNPSPDTLFKEIRKIRPGHFLEASLENENISFFIKSFITPLPKTVKARSPNLVNEYGKQLENAVKRQLLSDVEVGIFLSGGIDSALIASLAKNHYKGKLKAFTVGFDGEHIENEIEEARETADFLKLDHYYKIISFSDFLGMIKECIRIVEEPLATTSMIPMYFLSELTAKHVKVVLAGQGADEPLGGYTRYKSEFLQSKMPLIFQILFRQLARIVNIKNENILRGIGVLGIKNEIKRFLSIYEIFNEQEIYQLINVSEHLSSKRISYFYDLLNCRSKKDSVEKMMAIDMHLNLSDDLLNYTDKITMNFSLECRVPMLDLELVEYIQSLPLRYKLNLNGGKIIHKQFAREILPEKIISRKKKGFKSPTNKWFKEESNLIREILLDERSNFATIFNQNYIAQILNQHSNGFNREKQIFLLLILYYFFEANFNIKN